MWPQCEASVFSEAGKKWVNCGGPARAPVVTGQGFPLLDYKYLLPVL